MSLDQSRRRRGVSFSFEAIENRLMLAAAVTLASSGIEDSIMRVSDRALYSKYELDITRQWAVATSTRTDPAKLAEKLGASAVRPSGLIDGVFIATFARAKLSRVGGATLAKSIESVVGQDASWPLVARQQSTRAVPNDPRFANQWHLQNTGQGGGTVGADANIVNVWDHYKGSGVVIGVVDDGVTPNHQDLAPNYLPAFSYDFNRGDPIPDGGSHGTSVAGVSAARGNNGVGGSGAAPLAGIAGLQLIDGSSDDAMEANALSYFRQDIDIYNNSWGPYDWGTILEGPGPLTLAAMQQSVLNGRGGLGSIYTWAGGNGGSGDNSNFDGYANSRYTIAVGAITNTGAKASYSERGSNLLISAYSDGGTRGIDTTAGSSNTAYTTSFGGTSSATPLVSGVIALMLEANPSLTWRDVQHILAKSAEKVSPTDSGWSNNGAGLPINDKFGFGGIDAAAAVALAESWTTVAPEVSDTTGTVAVNTAIPGASVVGVSSSATFTTPIRIEYVEVVLNAQHLSRGELQVILVAPSGTESILATERSDTGDHFTNWTFGSTRMLDEDARGTWTLKLIDDSGATAGTFVNWKLNVYGTALATTPTVGGVVYQDLNGNGSRDGDELGLAGASVWVDLNLDGNLDAGEPSTTTSATGTYSIPDLALGNHVVRVAPAVGAYLTEGSAGRSFTLSEPQGYVYVGAVGVVSPAATGIVFDDTDADGVFDATESGLAGINLFADLDNDGIFDAGEPTTTTTADGSYRLEGLPLGAPVSVLPIAPAGRRLTGANAAGFVVTTSAAAYVASGFNVGATNTIRLSGRSFDDQNRDGVYTPGEPGVAGARVFLDANNNGIRDDSNYDVAQNTSLSLPDNTTRTSPLVISGTGSAVNNLNVRVAITHTWVGDLTVTLISPAGTRVLLADSNGSQRNGMNVTFSQSASTTPNSWPSGDGAAITGTYRPLGNLTLLNGQALDGTWTLEVRDNATGDTGTLTSWSLFGGFTESSVFTAADGTYVFDALPAGTYRIRQEAPPEPYEPSPALANPIVVTAAAGTVHVNQNLANHGVVAPTFVSGNYAFDAATPAVVLAFSVPVLVDPEDLVLQNLTTGQTVTGLAISYGAETNNVLVGASAGVFADGSYKLTIGTGVTSVGGVPLATSHDVEFFVLAGDANRDRVVNFDDLLILAQNYGSNGRLFSQGNFDYSADGAVTFDDLLLLAQRYGSSVPAVVELPKSGKPAKPRTATGELSI